MYWLGTHRWCHGPCASATTVWVCLLSFPRHSCRSCVVFFYHAYRVMFVFSGMRHAWAFGLASPFFIPPWNKHCPNNGLCPHSPLCSYSYHLFSIPWSYWPCWPIGSITSFLGFTWLTYLIFISYSSRGPVGYCSYLVGPLSLLPLFLGFLGSLTSSLPFILPMGLLAVIPAMLAH